jgi:hypothetical protein
MQYQVFMEVVKIIRPYPGKKLVHTFHSLVHAQIEMIQAIEGSLRSDIEGICAARFKQHVTSRFLIILGRPYV